MTNAAKPRIERIARQFFATEGVSAPVSVFPVLGKGFVNEVWIAEAETRRIVVRLNAEDDRAAAVFRKEKWCMEQAELIGIPGPKPLDIGQEDGIPYAIQTFEPGMNGLEVPERALVVWGRLGQYARLLHAIPVQGYGEEFADGAFYSPPHPGSDGSWAGYLRYGIDSLNDEDPLLKLGVFSKERSGLIRRMFERLAARQFRFGLNHNDLSLKNVLVNENPGDAPCVVLLDWGSAEAYPVPYGDLLQLMLTQWREGTPNQQELQAYIDGYGLTANETETARELLLLRSFDKLRWALDCSPGHIEEYAAFAKHAVQSLDENKTKE